MRYVSGLRWTLSRQGIALVWYENEVMERGVLSRQNIALRCNYVKGSFTTEAE